MRKRIVMPRPDSSYELVLRDEPMTRVAYVKPCAPEDLLLETSIAGEPVSYGRATPIANAYSGRLKMVTSAKSRAWKLDASKQMRWARKGAIVREPVRLILLAVGKRPKRLCDGPRSWRPTKPDLDNVCKSVSDALVMAEIIADDVLICEIRAFSLYAASGETPRVEIRVEKL